MPDDEDRKAILSRRNRLVAIALSGLASASTGCYDSHVAGATPPGRDSGTIDSGTTPTVCLGAPYDGGFDAGDPVPCLGAPLDAGSDAGFPTPCLSMAGDAGPTACLDIDVRDAGPGDAGPEGGVVPTPCLTAGA